MVLSLHESTFARLLETYPDFRARIEERIAQYDYKRVARVPLDFAEETLPAEVRARRSVSMDQIDAPPTRSRPADASKSAAETGRAVRVRRRSLREEGQAHSQVPADLSDRRDGLRRRVPGDDLPSLWARREPRAHSPARAHESRRIEPARTVRGGVGARTRRARGQSVAEEFRRRCRSRRSSTGRAITGRCCTT